jgi:hypothetical protein
MSSGTFEASGSGEFGVGEEGAEGDVAEAALEGS